MKKRFAVSDGVWFLLGALAACAAGWAWTVAAEDRAEPGSAAIKAPLPRVGESAGDTRSGLASASVNEQIAAVYALSPNELPEALAGLDGGASVPLWEALLGRLAETDPVAALRALENAPIRADLPVMENRAPTAEVTLQVENPKDKIRSRILLTWMEKDAAAAKIWMRAHLTGAQLRPDVVAALAAGSLVEAMELVESLPGGKIDRGILRGLMTGAAEGPVAENLSAVRGLAKTYPAAMEEYAAARYIAGPQEAARLADLLTDEEFRGRAGTNLIGAVSEADPRKGVELGLRWFGENLNSEVNQDTLRAMAGGTYSKKLEGFWGLPGELQLLFLAKDFGNWSAADPSAAAAYAESLPDPLLREVLRRAAKPVIQN